MSRYLHNIAAKSLDVASTVKPRLLGRFEPASNLTGATHVTPSPAGERLGGERLEGENATDEISHQVTRSPDRWQQVSHGSVRFNASTQSRQANQSWETEARVSPTETIRVVQPAISGSPMSVPYPAIEDTPSHLPATGSASIHTSPDGLSDLASVLPNVLPNQVSQSTSPANQELLQSSQSIPVKTTLSNNASAVAYPSQTQAPPALLRQSPTDATHSEPTPLPIQVTIGRIDVRAVAPTPAARRPATKPSAPPPSLNDYLKSRQQSLRGRR